MFFFFYFSVLLFHLPWFPQSAAATPKTAVTSTTDVTLEVLSNWGHASRVGLTEVEFYNNAGEKISLTPSDVWVQGAKDMQGMLGNLVNGRAKVSICWKHDGIVKHEVELMPGID